MSKENCKEISEEICKEIFRGFLEQPMSYVLKEILDKFLIPRQKNSEGISK